MTRFCYACGGRGCDYCNDDDHPQSGWREEVANDDVVLDRALEREETNE